MLLGVWNKAKQTDSSLGFQNDGNSTFLERSIDGTDRPGRPGGLLPLLGRLALVREVREERCGWAGVGPGSAGFPFFLFFFFFSFLFSFIIFDLELSIESNQF